METKNRLELEALAAVGEMLLFDQARGNPEEAARILRCARLFTRSEDAAQRLSELCNEAGLSAVPALAAHPVKGVGNGIEGGNGTWPRRFTVCPAEGCNTPGLSDRRGVIRCAVMVASGIATCDSCTLAEADSSPILAKLCIGGSGNSGMGALVQPSLAAWPDRLHPPAGARQTTTGNSPVKPPWWRPDLNQMAFTNLN